MGSRASQLRNRQQVQDSSAIVAGDHSSSANFNCKDQSNTINNNNNLSIADNNNIIDAVDTAKLKDAVEVIGTQTQQDLDSLRVAAAAAAVNGNNSDSSQPSKVSTLQRQASQIQSLAQRIRRSSSLRAPKLRALIPSFVNGKRKVSKIF